MRNPRLGRITFLFAEHGEEWEFSWSYFEEFRFFYSSDSVLVDLDS